MPKTHMTARRKPWLAALLSLVATGVGQVYNGQWKKGVVFFTLEIVLAFAMIPGFGSFPLMVGSIGILLLFNLYITGEAYFTARSKQNYIIKPYNRVWIYALVLVANLVTGTLMEKTLKEQFYQSFKVPSASMLPTVQIGDHFMAEILSDSTLIERGDILVFIEPGYGKHFVKRVIGLPGETVAMDEKIITIDERPLDEPYAQHFSLESLPKRDFFPPISLGQDEYFFMGDNRENSYDSRWFGPVRRTAIKGRAEYVYFPGNVGADDWTTRLGMKLR